MSDPNLHWDGTRWLRWDSSQWVDATTGAPIAQPEPAGAPAAPQRSQTTLILWGVLGFLAVLVVVALVVVVVMATRNNSEPTPVPSTSSSAPTTTPSATVNPTVIYTHFFVKPESGGSVYAVGVKTRGSQVSGWAGPLRTGDLTCFNGEIANGRVTGTLVPASEEGPGEGQSFSWPASGQGEAFKLLEVGTITGLSEAPVATVNNYAGLSAADDWQKTFTSCAQLTGGLS